MFDRFSRSWHLLKASAALLSEDRRLLVFPLLSGVCALVVAASFVLPALAWMGVFHGHVRHFDRGDGMGAAGYVLLFVFYLVQYTIIFFFNTALVGAAMMRLDGGRPTVGDGLRLAASKLPQILGYAALSATVGVILRAVQERLGLIGRWVIGLIGLAWNVATFLVVPLLAATDVGPIDAVKRSAALLRRTWGENIIGNGGLSLVFGLVMILMVLVFGGLFVLAGMAHSIVAMALLGAVVVVSFVLLGLVQSALQGVYAAVLYRYAEHGDAGEHFAPALLEQAFRPKRRK